MRKFTTSDGHSFKVKRLPQLITKLRAESWGGAASSRQEWMRETAFRAEQTMGNLVRTDTDAHFVNDLIETGLIKEITE